MAFRAYLLDSFYIPVSGLMTVNTNMNKTLFVLWAHLVVGSLTGKRVAVVWRVRHRPRIEFASI